MALLHFSGSMDVARRFFLHKKSKKIAQLLAAQLHCAKLIAEYLNVRKKVFHFFFTQRGWPVDDLPYKTVEVVVCIKV